MNPLLVTFFPNFGNQIHSDTGDALRLLTRLSKLRTEPMQKKSVSVLFRDLSSVPGECWAHPQWIYRTHGSYGSVAGGGASAQVRKAGMHSDTLIPASSGRDPGA